MAGPTLTRLRTLALMKLLGAAGLLLTAMLALGGCAEPPVPGAAPTPSATASAPATPGPAPTREPLALDAGSAGSDGLTVRYRDADGGLKTLPVEDFRR